jgi:hypothetical protein
LVLFCLFHRLLASFPAVPEHSFRLIDDGRRLITLGLMF